MKKILFLLAVLIISFAQNAKAQQSIDVNSNTGSGIPCGDVYVILYAYDVTSMTLLDQSNPILISPNTTQNFGGSFPPGFWVGGGPSGNWGFLQVEVVMDASCFPTSGSPSTCISGWNRVVVGDPCCFPPAMDCFEVYNPGSCSTCNLGDVINVSMSAAIVNIW